MEHTYSQAGTYDVELTVTSILNGCEADSVQEIAIDVTDRWQPLAAEDFGGEAVRVRGGDAHWVHLVLQPEAGQVRLSVYDALGREVARLVDGVVPAGRHTAVFDGGGLASGVYVARLEAERAIATRRMVLVR